MLSAEAFPPSALSHAPPRPSASGLSPLPSPISPPFAPPTNSIMSPSPIPIGNSLSGATTLRPSLVFFLHSNRSFFYSLPMILLRFLRIQCLFHRHLRGIILSCSCPAWELTPLDMTFHLRYSAFFFLYFFIQCFLRSLLRNCEIVHVSVLCLVCL